MPVTIAQSRPTTAPTITLPAGHALRALTATALVVDLAAVLTTAAVAALGRDSLGIFQDKGADVVTTFGLAGPVMLAGWILALACVGSYQADVFGAGSDEFKRVAQGTALTAAVVGISCYLAKFDLSRGFFVLAFCIGLPLLLGGRFALRTSVHRARRHGNLTQTVLITGSPEHVDEIASVLERETWLGYRVAGVLTTGDVGVTTPGGLPVVGRSHDVRTMVRELQPDVVFFADNSLGSSAAMREVVWDLENDRTQVVVAPSVADISGERVRIRPVGGLPLIHIEKPRAVQASRSAKRAFDVVGASALIVLFAPILLMSAARIWVHDRGPVLFSHTRIGRDGREFGCLKFRTMVTDAESLVAELRAQAGSEALLFKMKDDPRITVPGRWLRRFSIDELPQLVNVLRGDMSLVGPRPQVADEVALYEGGMSRRLLVRPGMTGLWQVSGRSDLSLEEAMRLDIFYVDNWSMVQDLAILGRTLKAVAGSRGAY